MSAAGLAIAAAERLALPDEVTAAGIALLVGRTRRRLATAPATDEAFAAAMAKFDIAEHPDAANRQHYELPPAFFMNVLGPRRKYSCCLYNDEQTTLADAEAAALEATIAQAGIADGQHILELGCGWGSLSLMMAQRFPAASITAVSNSAPQRDFIMARALALGLGNLRVVTADMNSFTTMERFDRVVSVEMFEHMSNWRPLLGRIRTWLVPEGALYLHIFTHRRTPYRFEADNDADWIGQYFFTGGIMPSAGLIEQFADLFQVEERWHWSGTHYARTAHDWLANFDANAATITPILEAVYGDDASLWRRRWRLFFLATAGLFGHAGGTEWGVSHYCLRPVG